MSANKLAVRLCASGLFLTGWLSLAAGAAEPAAETCASANCHASLVNVKNAHLPAESCDACHVPADPVHPQKGKKTFKLTQDPPALCTGCHVDLEEQLKLKGVHPALEAGCTSCHNPHGSAYPKLLADEGPKVCFACHDAIADKIEKGSSAHPPVTSEKACVTCHSPHASNNPKLLLEAEKTTCLGCHTTLITKTMTTLHGPIQEGKCTACHDPHGSSFPRLLASEFPADAYAPYTDTEFALCFGCHKRDLVQYPDTSFATNFRDGERNLHYVHVHDARKGRTCILCHDVHGAGNPVLIADSVPFGKWRLPLKFVKTETGGSCAPGCHKPRVYDRKVPGRKPETKEPRPDKASANSK